MNFWFFRLLVFIDYLEYSRKNYNEGCFEYYVYLYMFIGIDYK